jgi:hypothetical protein
VAAQGFMRVRCGDCAHDRLVPVSCKRRGFCPSCGGRRMAQEAGHLVERVLPFVRVWQWVVSLPFALRFRVANDHRLLSAVLTTPARGRAADSVEAEAGPPHDLSSVSSAR